MTDVQVIRAIFSTVHWGHLADTPGLTHWNFLFPLKLGMLDKNRRKKQCVLSKIHCKQNSREY